MLINLLNAAATLWPGGEPIEGLDSKWIWIATVILGIILLIAIIALFFKAAKRTRERKEEKRIQQAVAEATGETKQDKKAAKKAAKAEKQKQKEEQSQQTPVVVLAGAEPQKQEERVLIGITLDSAVVQREFTVGDDFNCDGLIVNATYNIAPLQEMYSNIMVVDSATFDMAVNGTLAGVYACEPDMRKAGKTMVRVCFNKQLAIYPVAIKEKAAAPVAEPVQPVQPEVVAAPVAEPVVENPAHVLTGITLDVGVVQREFSAGDDFNCKGLVINATYSTEPLSETINNVTSVDSATFDMAVSGALSGAYACEPDMSKVGKTMVRVCYNKQLAIYPVAIKAKPVVEQPVEPKKEETVAAVVAEAQPVEKSAERMMTGITLDVGIVQREFSVGDSFDCDGLLVNATYDKAPLQETIADYTVVDQATFNQALAGVMPGVYVCSPDINKVGKMAVRVCYNKQLAIYTISIKEKLVEKAAEPVVQPVAQPVAEQPTTPREMISLTVNTDYVRRDFYVGESLVHDGLLVYAHYNKEPFKEQVSNYTVISPDMSREGNPTVVVMYQDRASSYTVTVRANPNANKQPEQPVQPVQPQKERVMTHVSINADFVKKDYVVGDTFSREGLMVMAHYNVEPLQEQITNFTVIPPDMNREGMAAVMVAYQDRMLSYQINIRPAPVVAKPEPVVAPVVEQPKAPVRELQSVTLDTAVVQREFEVGDEFNCDGLLVNANYNTAPTIETYADYNIIDSASFDQILRMDMQGVYVAEPNMTVAGRKAVRVSLNNHIALYTIIVREKKNEVEPEEVEEEPQVEVQPQVVVVEKEVPVNVEAERALLYVTVSADKAKTEYTVGDNLNTKGLVVHAHFNKEPYMEQVTNFTVSAPDMSQVGTYTVGVSYMDKTVGYQISVQEAPVEEPKSEAIVVKADEDTPIVIEEESYEGRLRYDRSFQARIIQADDKSKFWYTDVKNELLSYKKVHGRISWKRETFKCGKSVVAKFAFRGNTLCIMLPLNPSEYNDSKYALEDVSNAPSNADTPAMLRIKSDKRVKQAIELIEEVMSELNIDKDKKYQPEDFYVPYEGVFELIKKGLIKREIKTAADEAVFTSGQVEEDAEDDSYELTEVAPGVFVSPKK